MMSFFYKGLQRFSLWGAIFPLVENTFSKKFAIWPLARRLLSEDFTFFKIPCKASFQIVAWKIPHNSSLILGKKAFFWGIFTTRVYKGFPARGNFYPRGNDIQRGICILPLAEIVLSNSFLKIPRETLFNIV